MQQDQRPDGQGTGAGTKAEPISPLRTWLAAAGALTWCWLKMFLVTVATFIALALLLGVACSLIVPGRWELKTAVGAGVAVLCAGAGVLLAPHRATAETTSFLVLRHRLASRVLEYLFQAYTKEDSHVAVAAGKLPLAEAEAKLRHCVAALRLDKLTVGPMTRWIVRKVHAQLVRQIERCTLAEYRREAAQGGMVDLQLVQQRMAGRIDQEIADRIVTGPRHLVRWLMIGSAILLLGSSIACRVLASPASPAATPATMPSSSPPSSIAP